MGLALDLVFPFVNIALDGVGGTGATGIPLSWRWYATGFPPPPIGLNLDIDLVFWMAVGLILMQAFFRVMVPRFLPKRGGAPKPST